MAVYYTVHILNWFYSLVKDKQPQIAVAMDHRSCQHLWGSASLTNGKIAPLEDIVIADIVTHEDMLWKYFEEIGGTDLFFVLWAAIKDDIFTKLSQKAQRLADVVTREMRNHAGIEK